jgi:hypothetical protein
MLNDLLLPSLLGNKLMGLLSKQNIFFGNKPLRDNFKIPGRFVNNAQKMTFLHLLRRIKKAEFFKFSPIDWKLNFVFKYK